MLHLLDEALEAFLRAAAPLSEGDVDVAFEAPDRDWAARISRPTVNLYLWDLRRNVQQPDGGGLERVRDENGALVHRPPLPWLDCRYLVTAWTSEVRDEHALLGSVLAAFLRTPVLPEELLDPALRAVRPRPELTVGAREGKDVADFWSALGGQLKPSLDLVVTAPFDAAPLWSVARVVREATLVLGPAWRDPTTGQKREVPFTGRGEEIRLHTSTKPQDDGRDGPPPPSKPRRRGGSP
jgi:hypothetical protein